MEPEFENLFNMFLFIHGKNNLKGNILNLETVGMPAVTGKNYSTI